jgi:uncharacterized damage-inducible protein DinB
MSLIRRPEENEFPPSGKVYVSQVDSDDVVQALTEQIGKTATLLRSVGEEKAMAAYAPGKWSIKQVLGHMSDTERIFAYRVLRIARGDATPLAGFEQNEYVPNAGSNERTIQDLLQEFATVRESTLTLVRGLPAEAWDRFGTASGSSVSVRGVVFMIAGHELHHRKLLEERYLKTSGA